jgi:hypothetical protein
MKAFFDDGKFAFGYMTREEIEKQGFRDTLNRYCGREIYAKEDLRIAFDSEDNWFTRYRADERVAENQNA